VTNNFSEYGYSHAENAGTAADIKDNLVLEDVLILVDGITIRPSTDIVFLHAIKVISF
jgi:hypothetical protein